MSEATPFDPSRYLTKVGQADYLEVKWRLVWLREIHPDATISTDLISHDASNQWAMFRAYITIPGGGSAAGHGSESAKDFREYIEKAETKAIGRALAALGFGTQFCDDFDFGQGGGKIVDSPVAHQNGARATTDFASTRGAHPHQVHQGGGSSNLISPAQLSYIEKLANEAGVFDSLDQIVWDTYGRKINELEKRDASSFIDKLQSEARMNKR